MSLVKLQSIQSYKNTGSLPLFYVGAVVESQSGQLDPTLYTTTEQIDSELDDFPYIHMYKELIKDEIPSCLLPVITRESKYNLPSLRLSNGPIAVSHPHRYKKYTPTLLNGIISKEFDPSSLDFDPSTGLYSITIEYDLYFYPKVLVIDSTPKPNTDLYMGESVSPSEYELIYHSSEDNSKKFITAYFTSPFIGSITIESIPIIEPKSDHDVASGVHTEYVSTGQFILNNLSESELPEIVVTDPYGHRVDYEFNRDGSDGIITFNYIQYYGLTSWDVNSQKWVEDLSDLLRYRIDIRRVPKALIESRDFNRSDQVGDSSNEIKKIITQLKNNNSKSIYRLQEIELTDSKASELDFKVSYESPTMIVLDFESENSDVKFNVQYNIITTESNFNFNSLWMQEKSMNIILDFTNVSLSDLTIKGSDINKGSNYILLQTQIDTSLIQTGPFLDVTSSYRSDNAICDIQQFIRNWDPSNGSYSKSDVIQYIKDWYNARYAIVCFDLRDLLLEFITEFFDSYTGLNLLQDQYGDQIYISDFINEFIEGIYAYEFWLASNQFIVNLFTPILNGITGTGSNLITKEIMLDKVKNMELELYQLLFKFPRPIQDLNHYKMPGLNISSSFNLTQDQLCEFTERDKVIDFYSKIKGPAGCKISITIEKLKFYDGLYDLTITNGLKVENFRVRLYQVNTHEDDVIYISDLNQKSELVSVVFYNYFDSNTSTLMDSMEFNPDDLISGTETEEELKTKLFHPDNIRDNSELILPEGTFYLDRVVLEEFTDEDRLNSLKLYAESNWYPDLFLVDKMPDMVNYARAILDLVQWNEDKDQSIYSQALINMNCHHLNREWYQTYQGDRTWYLSSNNRLLWFMGDMTVEGQKYPGYYHHIKSIKSQTYLNIPSMDLIYDPLPLKVGNGIMIYRNGVFKEVGEILSQSDSYLKIKIHHVKLDRNVQLKYTTESNQTSDEIRYCIIDKSGNLTWVEDYNLYHRIVEVQLENDKLDPIVPKYTYSDIKTALENSFINYLRYDNLKYYYLTIAETPDQLTIFPIQYITSKVTRECYSELPSGIGLTLGDISIKLSTVCDRCRRALPLINSINSDVAQLDSNHIQVTFTVEVPKLSNKVFKLNYYIDL